MPANPATVTVSVEQAQPSEAAENLPLIIGYDSEDTDENVFKDYYDHITLRAVHGKTTKTGISGQTHFNQRAERVVVVKPDQIAVTNEALGTPATGTLDNFPISNTTPPVFEQDSVARTVVPTDESPITSVPAGGTVLVNFATGEYKFPAVATTDATVDYVYFDYDALLSNYKTSLPDLGPVTLVTVPGLEATLATVGDISGLATIAEQMFWLLIVQTPTDSTIAQDKAVREAIDSSHVMLVKSKDEEIDLAAAIAGIASRTSPFTTLAFKEIRGIDTAYFLDTDIGDVETDDTFEGEGINVVHRIGGKNVLANERTAIVFAGSTEDNKDEIYASRVLAKIALRNRIEAAMSSLLVREGFNLTNSASGVGSVHTELVKVMENGVSDGEIRKDYSVTDPPNLPNSQYAPSTGDAKRKRIGPFTARGKMIESAHELIVNGYMEVA